MSGRAHAGAKKPSVTATRGSKAAASGRAKSSSARPTKSAAARRPVARPRPAANKRQTTTSRQSVPKRQAASPGPRNASARPRANSRRLPVAIAVVIALVVVGTSFPAAALLRQHGQLSSTSAQLQRLQHQNQLLAQQQKQLNSQAEIERFARQDYQLVFPGQTLFNVLPATGSAATATAAGALAGDPGNQPLVAPADAPNMSPDPGLPQSGTTGSSGSSASSSGGSGSTTTAQRAGSSVGTSGGASAGGFWHRVTTTVEFWK